MQTIRSVVTQMEKSPEFFLWSCEKTTRNFLSALTALSGTQRVLEIGTFIGFTTTAFIEKTSIRSVVTLDIMDKFSQWKRKLPKAIRSRISFHLGTSEKYFLKHPQQRFDFVFIDADHRLRPCLQDVGLSLKHICTGGYICLHDYNGKIGTMFEGPRLTVYFLRFLNVFCLYQLLEFCSFQTEKRQNGSSSGLALMRIKGPFILAQVSGEICLWMRKLLNPELPLDHERLFASLLKKKQHE